MKPFYYVGVIAFVLIVASPHDVHASDEGELFGSPSSGPTQLHRADGTWIGIDWVSKEPLPFAKKVILTAVIDSGVYLDHPQLKNFIVDYKDFSGEGIEDRAGHGTISAILAARAGEKIAPQVRESFSKLLIAKVTKMVNGKARPSRSAVISAIKWSVTQGVEVINMSLGFPDDDDQANTKLCQEIARHKKVVFIAAAGNSGPQIRFFPAACETDNLISVGVKASYSGPSDVQFDDAVQLRVLD